MVSGIQSFKFLGPKIWAIEAKNIKHCKYLQEFKRLIKVWKREACLAEYAKSTLQILVSFD